MKTAPKMILYINGINSLKGYYLSKFPESEEKRNLKNHSSKYHSKSDLTMSFKRYTSWPSGTVPGCAKADSTQEKSTIGPSHQQAKKKSRYQGQFWKTIPWGEINTLMD